MDATTTTTMTSSERAARRAWYYGVAAASAREKAIAEHGLGGWMQTEPGGRAIELLEKARLWRRRADLALVERAGGLA